MPCTSLNTPYPSPYLACTKLCVAYLELKCRFGKCFLVYGAKSIFNSYISYDSYSPFWVILLYNSRENIRNVYLYSTLSAAMASSEDILDSDSTCFILRLIMRASLQASSNFSIRFHLRKLMLTVTRLCFVFKLFMVTIFFHCQNNIFVS